MKKKQTRNKAFHNTITRMSSEPVAMRLIVDRMTDACENITFPCGRKIFIFLKVSRSHTDTQIFFFRYLAVCHPFKHAEFAGKTVDKAIAGIVIYNYVFHTFCIMQVSGFLKL